MQTAVFLGILMPSLEQCSCNIRLPGTEHREKEYHQQWLNVKIMLQMLPVFAVGGVISAFLMIWI